MEKKNEKNERKKHENISPIRRLIIYREVS